jgi:protein TonB
MFVWALMLSAGLHILAAVMIPNIRWEDLKKPEVLQVELAPPQKAPEPEPAPVELQPEPEPPPPPPKEVPKPRITPQPEPKPVPSPEPVAEPLPPQSEPEVVAPPPAVITAPPVEEPAFTAPPPPPEPPRPTGPTQSDLDAARNLYKSMLEREILKHKTYPRIATMRGWQGEAVIELQIDSNGQPSQIRVQTSSGYEVLDKTAMDMVRKTVSSTRLPEILRGTISTFLVPVSFRLQE